MNLVVILAVVAVGACTADRLDRTYLPPASAKTAGGDGESLRAPAASYGSPQNTPQFIHSTGPKFSGSQFNPDESLGPSQQSSTGPSAYQPQPKSSYNQGRPPTYGPPSNPPGGSFNSPFQNNGPSRFNVPNNGNYNGEQHTLRGPERALAQFERNAATLRLESDVRPDGYEYSFETENGIKAQQVGQEAGGIRASGDFSYTGDDGVPIELTYEADENGYRPRGAHLPTPPPIPDAILRSIQQNAEDEANGITDDGSYSAEKYQGPSENQGQYNNGQQGYQYQSPNSRPGQYNRQPSFNNEVDSPQKYNNRPNQPSKQYIPSPQQYQQQPSQQYSSPKPYSMNAPNPYKQQSGPQNNRPFQPEQGNEAPSQQYNRPIPSQNQLRPDQNHQQPQINGPYRPGQMPSSPSQQFTRPDQEHSGLSHKSNGPSQPQTPQPFNSPAPQNSEYQSVSSHQYSSPEDSESVSPGSPSKQHEIPKGPSTQPIPNRPPNSPAKPYSLPQQPSYANQQSSHLQGVSGHSQTSQYDSPRPGMNSQPGQSSKPSQNYGQRPSGPGEQFGGPRQPPSFDSEKGYKY